MQVSFTGIKITNCSSNRHNNNYSSTVKEIVNGSIKSKEIQHNENVQTYKLNLMLDNSSNEGDLDNYISSFKKSAPCYRVNCINRAAPGKVNIVLEKQSVNIRGKIYTNNLIKINDYEIMNDDIETLSIYKNIRNIAEKIAENKDKKYSPHQVQCAYEISKIAKYEAERLKAKHAVIRN